MRSGSKHLNILNADELHTRNSKDSKYYIIMFCHTTIGEKMPDEGRNSSWLIPRINANWKSSPKHVPVDSVFSSQVEILIYASTLFGSWGLGACVRICLRPTAPAVAHRALPWVALQQPEKGLAGYLDG